MRKIYSSKNDSNIYKKARKAVGLTQAEVSKQLNINRSTISTWEIGRSIPDPALLPKIAKLYNVTTDYLLGFDNDLSNKNEYTATFGTVLKLRELRGSHTQDHMAKLLGLDCQTYCDYENGKRQADYTTLIRMADYFNVSIDYLLGRSEFPSVFTPQTASQIDRDDETAAILEILEELPYGGKVLIRRYAELTYKDFSQMQEKRDNSIKKLS